VKKRIKGKRPRAKGLISVASRPNERWSTDLIRVLYGDDGWCTLAIVIDCATREVIGWRLARRGNAATVEVALEGAPDFSVWQLGWVPGKLVLRSDNGLVFYVHEICSNGESLWAQPGIHHAVYTGAAERFSGEIYQDT